MNLATLVRQQALSHADKPAVEYRGAAWSYEECWRRVESLAAGLHARDIGFPDRVGLCLSDHPEHVLLHFALARAGACLVPIDHRWSASEKQAAAATFGVRAVVVEAGAGIEGVDTIPLDAIRAGRGEPLPTERDAPDLPFAMSLSSGTTGRPKGAIVTHGQMLERFDTQWVSLGIGTADRFILASPLCFGAGRSFSLSILAAGGTLILNPPPYEPAELRDAIVASGATATFLVPTMMRRLVALSAEGPMFPGLRRLLVSGEAIHADEVDAFRARLTPNLVGYYATSEGGGVSVLQPGDFERRGDTVGQAAHRVELEIVGDGGEPRATGDIGRIRYRGPGVSRILVDEAGETQASSDDGWFYPGDLGSIDNQGYLSLRGREQDVIVRGGVNVYPAEVERVLCSHPGIREAAVIGVPSVTHGEAIVACIASESGASDEELLAHCRKRLAPYKLPIRWLRFASLPKARSGKTDKEALRRIVAGA